MVLSNRSTLRDLMRHPLGKDVVDKLIALTAAPTWLPGVLGGVKLSTLDKLASRLTGGGITDALITMCNRVDGTLSHDGPDEVPWWREAVFYQIYPRSFADSDGDGVGDLRGIISQLDMLVDLGVDCLWLSPIYASPNHDMGYDISDYRAVMPEMGSLADVDELIAGCHERGMRIILDLVVNHTSSEHEWFQKALADPDGEYGKYYFFVDGEPDAPPNNWRSFFSGPPGRGCPSNASGTSTCSTSTSRTSIGPTLRSVERWQTSCSGGLTAASTAFAWMSSTTSQSLSPLQTLANPSPTGTHSSGNCLSSPGSSTTSTVRSSTAGSLSCGARASRTPMAPPP